MAQSVTGSWDALLAALQTLFPDPAVVTSGDPGEYTADLIVTLLELRAPVTRPTSGTGRSRDKTVEIDVLFSQYVAGGDEAQQPANQGAWAAADQLEAYLRVQGNERLGGNCYDAWVANTDLRPYTVWVNEDGLQQPVPAGRAADVTSTVTVRVRI